MITLLLAVSRQPRSRGPRAKNSEGHAARAAVHAAARARVEPSRRCHEAKAVARRPRQPRPRATHRQRPVGVTCGVQVARLAASTWRLMGAHVARISGGRSQPIGPRAVGDAARLARRRVLIRRADAR